MAKQTVTKNLKESIELLNKDYVKRDENLSAELESVGGGLQSQIDNLQTQIEQIRDRKKVKTFTFTDLQDYSIVMDLLYNYKIIGGKIQYKPQSNQTLDASFIGGTILYDLQNQYLTFETPDVYQKPGQPLSNIDKFIIPIGVDITEDSIIKIVIIFNTDLYAEEGGMNKPPRVSTIYKMIDLTVDAQLIN